MKERIAQDTERIFRTTRSGLAAAHSLTAMIDRLLVREYRSVVPSGGLALVATGGYGRAELCPYSDIDIMILSESRGQVDGVETFLYKLWDTGLDISHSFRTPSECIEEAHKDIRTRTSLLEGRLLAGDKALFRTFRQRVYPEVAYRKQRDFIREKLLDMGRRHRESGDSPYLLEPHVKEGDGGLRDVHTALWLSRIALKKEGFADFLSLLEHDDRRRFISAYDFLVRIRFALHIESGRKNDTLSFEYQPAVARRVGFLDSKKFSGMERMLRYYYLKSRVVRDMAHELLDRCSRPYVPVRRDLSTQRLTDDFWIAGGSLIAKDRALFRSQPGKVIEAFRLSSRSGRRFSRALREAVRQNLFRINRRVAMSPSSSLSFLDILRSDRVYETLREMHDMNVLGRFLPEFGALRLLVVHAPYHRYTVDEHTLVAIRNLECLKTSHYRHLDALRVVMKNFRQPDVLYMALLFHDIGKAAGRHHEEEGYKRLKRIMERLPVETAKRLRVEFLVRNHVRMSTTALMRDASDEATVARFADVVGDRENLEALYLITYADMSAVNPTFWSSWKAHLLHELYERTNSYLAGIQRGPAAYIADLMATAPRVDAAGLKAFVEEMPDRYVVATPPERVLQDYALVRRMRGSGFAMQVAASDAAVEISVCAEDSPGLFSRIAGFLSAQRLNIVHGSIYTGKGGIIIDKISVSNWTDLWWDGMEQELEEGLRSIVVERRPVVAAFREPAAAPGQQEVFIEIDNESSDESTVVEILSTDRMGLLHDVTDCLRRLGVNILTARIQTESGLAQDVFYVQKDRRQIDYASVQAILAELWNVLRS